MKIPVNKKDRKTIFGLILIRFENWVVFNRKSKLKSNCNNFILPSNSQIRPFSYHSKFTQNDAVRQNLPQKSLQVRPPKTSHKSPCDRIVLLSHILTHKRRILSFLIMVYIESWDDFVEKSVQMFRSDPEKVQFLQLNHATFIWSRFNAISFIFLILLRLWRMSFYCADSLCHEIQALRRQIGSESYRW